MRNYSIITESTCDLTDGMAKELDITILPMTFTIDGKVYHNHLDGREMNSADFYGRLRQGQFAQTAQVNELEFEELFEAKVRAGLDVLCINFSSALSGTSRSAAAAAETVQKKHPEAKIITVDSKCASVGQGLLVCLAARLRREGKTIEQAAEFAESNKLKICHWFTVNDLDYLKRGGRVSAAAALFGGMMGIKPILRVNNEGGLVSYGKVRGREQSMQELVKRMEEGIQKQTPQDVFIGHGDCPREAEKLAGFIRGKLKRGKTYISDVGQVIGAHTGPELLVIAFLGESR